MGGYTNQAGSGYPQTNMSNVPAPGGYPMPVPPVPVLKP